MIKGLSNSIVYFILFLLVLVGGSGYLIYDYLVPMREQADQELSNTKAAVQAKYNEVAKMKEEFILLQSQLRDFKELEARGFFDDQNRAKASDAFNKLADRVGILKASVSFASGDVVANDLATLAKQMVIKSHGVVDVESLDDVDVYTLLKYMQEKYPGNIDVTSLKLERDGVFDINMIRSIGRGDPVPMVKGSFEFDWRTMTPNDQVAGGGQ